MLWPVGEITKIQRRVLEHLADSQAEKVLARTNLILSNRIQISFSACPPFPSNRRSVRRTGNSPRRRRSRFVIHLPMNNYPRIKKLLLLDRTTKFTFPSSSTRGIFRTIIKLVLAEFSLRAIFYIVRPILFS